LCGTVDGHLTDCKLFKRPNNEKKPSSPQPHTRSTSSSSSSPSSIFIPPPPPQLSETQYVKNGQCALCGTVDGHLTHCRLFKRSNNEYKPTTNQPPQSSSFKFTASTSSYSSSSSHRYNNYNRCVASSIKACTFCTNISSSYSVTCPYSGCYRQFSTTDFYQHATTTHVYDQSQAYACPICAADGVSRLIHLFLFHVLTVCEIHV
jgi:hypothetical protein